MNKRIEKVREDIRLAEKKLAEMNEYLKTLRIKEKRLCDEEILKTMRSMAGKGGDVMELLSKISGEQESSAVEMPPNNNGNTVDRETENAEDEAVMETINTDYYREENENERDQ